MMARWSSPPLYWGRRGNPNPKLASEATSVVAFRATDGTGSPEYAGIIIDAHAASSSEEGPNEPLWRWPMARSRRCG